MSSRIMFVVGATATLLTPSVVHAETVAPARPTQGAEVTREKLLTLDEAKRQYRGPLSRRVLEFLTVMDRVVNKDKKPALTTDDWEPLGRLIDRDKFRRVGNFGVKNDWSSYSQMLTRWANSSWWKGYIWRLREVPSSAGRPGLVYLESEERSSQKHPVRVDGDYRKLASIAVYEFDSKGRIVGLHVYDQRPL